MNKINYKKVFFSILYIGTFNNIFSTNNYLIANQINEFKLDKENLKTEYISKNIKSEYILGPRDQINITFRGLNDFSGIFIIDRDGYISLPELGLVEAGGKTITELKLYLLEIYKNYIYKYNEKLVGWFLLSNNNQLINKNISYMMKSNNS